MGELKLNLGFNDRKAKGEDILEMVIRSNIILQVQRDKKIITSNYQVNYHMTSPSPKPNSINKYHIWRWVCRTQTQSEAASFNTLC